MSMSLPEMGDWDSVFDETYLQTYLPSFDEQRTRAEALGAASLAEVEPGAEILDCPTGFGRHALVLAEEGYRVTGLDRSPTMLAEAESRRSDAEWPRLVAATTVSCRSRTRASMRSSTCSRRSDTSSGTRTSASFASSAGCCDRVGHSSWRRPTATGSHASPRPSRGVGTGFPTARCTSRSARPTGRGNDRHLPRHRLAHGRARRAAVPPPRVLGEGVGRDAARGRVRRSRGIRRVGRSHIVHARRLATHPSRPLSRGVGSRPMRVQFDRFYTYAELTKTLEAWAAEHPELFSSEVDREVLRGPRHLALHGHELGDGSGGREAGGLRPRADPRDGVHGHDRRAEPARPSSPLRRSTACVMPSTRARSTSSRA